MDRIYKALSKPEATQCALQYCLTFAHSCTHWRWGQPQPARQELFLLGGSRDQTRTLPVTSQPALPPEPLATQQPSLVKWLSNPVGIHSISSLRDGWNQNFVSTIQQKTKVTYWPLASAFHYIIAVSEKKNIVTISVYWTVIMTRYVLFYCVKYLLGPGPKVPSQMAWQPGQA
jgi:hypothetical protein